MRRIAYLLAGAVAAVGLALSGAGAASATVEPQVVGTVDGTSGYISTIFGANLTTQVATFDLTPQAENIGTTTSLASPNGAEGIGLCNNLNGKAAQVGALWNGTAFEIAYAVGTLKGNGADACVNDSILTDGAVLHPLLSGLAPGTSVSVFLEEFARGVGIFAENDNTGQSFSAYASFATRVWVPGHWVNCHDGTVHGHVVHICTWKRGHWKTTFPHAYYNESQTGVEQNLRNLGGPAVNDLVDFTGVFVNGISLGSNAGLIQDNAITVDSSGTGVAPWLTGVAKTTTTGPNGELCANLDGILIAGAGRFSVCAATPTGA